VSYDPAPAYPLARGEVRRGYGELAAALSAQPGGAIALDGPAALPWDDVIAGLRAALGPGIPVVDVRTLEEWAQLGQRLQTAVSPADPCFAPLFAGALGDLFRPAAPAGPAVLAGAGSGLAQVDQVWLLGFPKRLGLELVRSGLGGNLGGPAGAPPSEQRLVFVDWPLLERHHQALLPGATGFVDATDPAQPRFVRGEQLRASLALLARAPFRTVPSFLPGPWGGQWLRSRLGIETEAPNLAWSYELIAPEAGIRLGCLEVPFELLLATEAEAVLGPDVAARYGRSFPIRFDYLDTFGGGHLSLQCHPTPEYAAAEFGLPYTQQESYYVVETTPGARVFLGLQEDADVEAFRGDAHAAAERGVDFDVDRHVQAVPAERHRLYLIPPGTLHASGRGNVVLEISATPYLYTLRFFDWLRRGLDGSLRPVHLGHAFANLDETRRGAAATAELVQEPRVVRAGSGWAELELGRHADLLFAVHRLDFEDAVEDDTAGRFHLLNLVEGSAAELETERGGIHPLAFGESIVVPAAVGRYRLRVTEGPAARAVKAFVA
jgi:mannose-6-phosphate isomerase class I